MMILVQHFLTKDLIATVPAHYPLTYTQRITEVENNVGVVSEHFYRNQLGNMLACVNMFNYDIYVALILYLLTSCLTLY
jgi:hypothetical protein